MDLTREAPPAVGAETPPTRVRPVVLATLSVRPDPSAERMAIDSALEAGAPLILVNLLKLRNYPTTIALLGAEATTIPHEEDLDAVRATAARAAQLGISTKTVETYKARALEKLGLHSRADLVRYAVGRGWLQGL